MDSLGTMIGGRPPFAGGSGSGGASSGDSSGGLRDCPSPVRVISSDGLLDRLCESWEAGPTTTTTSTWTTTMISIPAGHGHGGSVSGSEPKPFLGAGAENDAVEEMTYGRLVDLQTQQASLREGGSTPNIRAHVVPPLGRLETGDELTMAAAVTAASANPNPNANPSLQAADAHVVAPVPGVAGVGATKARYYAGSGSASGSEYAASGSAGYPNVLPQPPQPQHSTTSPSVTPPPLPSKPASVTAAFLKDNDAANAAAVTHQQQQQQPQVDHPWDAAAAAAAASGVLGVDAATGATLGTASSQDLLLDWLRREAGAGDEEAQFHLAQLFSPPRFEMKPECRECGETFGVTRYRHHCRHCGGSFCHEHAWHEHPIPKLGLPGPQVRYYRTE